MGRVWTVLDDRHWLTWTSRRHILERARREMGLQGKAECFPHPGDVLITASQLSVEEKGLRLHRHASAANLERAAKALLKRSVKQIVHERRPVANLIVGERAHGEVHIGFWDHSRVGIPVTLVTIAVGWAWLAWVR